MVIFREILRSTFRRKGSLLAMIISIMLSVSMLLSVTALQSSVSVTLLRSSEKYNKADIVTWSVGKFYDVGLLSDLKNLPEVENAEFKFREFGGVIAKDATIHAVIFGINPSPKINKVVVDEEVWNNFRGNVCILEKTIAEKNGISVGDKILVMFKGVVINVSVIAFSETPWIISSGSPITVTVYIPIETMQNVIGLDEGYNYVEFVLNEGYSEEATLSKILDFLNELGYPSDGVVVRYTEIKNVADSVINLFFVLSIPILIIVFTISFISIYSGLLKEYNEIGIKKAIGYKDIQVFYGYMLRNIIIALLGFVFGIPLGYEISYIATKIIIENQLGEAYFVFSIKNVLFSVILVFIFVLMATIIPAYKAKKIDPIKLIKFGYQEYKYGKESNIIRKISNLHLLMGIRNIKRNKIRTTMVLLLLVATTLSVVSLSNVSRSFALTYKETILNCYKWDFVIGSLELFNNSHVKLISEDSEVINAEPQTWFWLPKNKLDIYHNGELVEKSRMLGDLMTIGILQNQTLFSPIVTEGTIKIRKGEVVISTKTAKLYNVKIGDTIIIRGEIFNNTFQKELKVIGIAQLAVASVWALVVNIEDAREIAGWRNGFNAIAVKIVEGVKEVDVITRIVKDLMKVGKHTDMVFVRKDLIKQTLDIINMVDAYSKIATLLFVMTASIGLLGALTSITLERRREITLLYTIGFKPFEILKIFEIEAILISLLTFLAVVLTLPATVNALSVLVNSPIFPIWVQTNITKYDFLLGFILPFANLICIYGVFGYTSSRKVDTRLLKTFTI